MNMNNETVFIMALLAGIVGGCVSGFFIGCAIGSSDARSDVRRSAINAGVAKWICDPTGALGTSPEWTDDGRGEGLLANNS